MTGHIYQSLGDWSYQCTWSGFHKWRCTCVQEKHSNADGVVNRGVVAILMTLTWTRVGTSLSPRPPGWPSHCRQWRGRPVRRRVLPWEHQRSPCRRSGTLARARTLERLSVGRQRKTVRRHCVSLRLVLSSAQSQVTHDGSPSTSIPFCCQKERRCWLDWSESGSQPWDALLFPGMRQIKT